LELNNGRLQKRHILLIALGFLGFVFYSIYINGFGANAPVMMSFYHIDAAQQGFIITMQGIGALSALIYISLHGERYNKINAFSLGMILFGAGTVLIGFAPNYILLLFMFMLCGAGMSSADVMMNSIIPELFPKQKNTLLPLLHAFFGLGAMLAPIFVTAIVNPDIPRTFTIPYLIIGITLVCFSICFFILTRRLIPETPYADMTAIKKRVAENPAEIFKSSKAWLFLAAGICYFSFFIGFTSWLPTYCREIGMDFNLSGTMLSMFFVGLLVMRFCGPLVLKKITPRLGFIVFNIISAVLAAMAILISNVSVMVVLLTLSGFVQGSCVVFLVLMCTATFPERIASASSLTFMSGSFAAMTAPLWMGALAEIVGYGIPMLIVCGLFALSVIPIIIMKKAN
jgi:fucose permease